MLMEAVQQLWEAYEAWKDLTRREGAAIQNSNWVDLRLAQQHKRMLQGEILRLTDNVHAACSSPEDNQLFNQRLREIVSELISLETRNNLLLQSCIDETRREREQLEATSSRLRRVHSRYVPSREPVWQNVS